MLHIKSQMFVNVELSADRITTLEIISNLKQVNYERNLRSDKVELILYSKFH